MTKKETGIEEGNKLIAEFMGGTRHYDAGYENIPLPPNKIIIGNLCARRFGELEYHKSFDWLMPAVGKFMRLVVDNKIQAEQLNDFDNHRQKLLFEIERFPDVPFFIFKQLSDSIRWYNSQTSAQ